jgi:PAS domain S-box-containing protein
MNPGSDVPAPPVHCLDHLLLVEDDEGLAELFRQRLEGCQLPIYWVRTGADALNHLANQPRSLVLLDYSLPDMTANQLIERMSSTGSVPPFVVVTGHGDEQVAVALMKLGARDYLIKDILLLDRLPSVINRILRELEIHQRLSASEEEAKRKEAELVAVYHGSPVMMCLVDQERRVVRMNRAVLEFVGRPQMQLTDTRTGNLIGCLNSLSDPGGCGYGAACQRCALRLAVMDSFAFGTNHRQLEFKYQLMRDGSAREIVLSVSTSLLKVGDQPRLLVCMEDVTQQRADEKRVREQATLLDKAQDAIWVTSLDLRFTYWNQSAERLYGWKASEVLGRKLNELFWDVIARPMEKNHRTVLQAGEWSGELHHVTKDSRELMVQSRWTLIRDEQGLPQSIFIINTDITEQKQLETQFLRAQRLDNLGQLAGGIAHDLNNILTPVLMTVHLLRQQTQDPDTLALLESLEFSAKRGAGVVKQVLTFARGSTGQKTVLHPKYFVAELAKVIEETFPKNIELKTHISKDQWPIHGDPTHLHQILLNLCVNARDAMPHGGTLAINVSLLTLDDALATQIPGAKTGPYVRLEVSDTGVGIPKENLDKIFDPFFTTKPPDQGTGLGLSTVLGLVKSYGGFIDVHSQIGHGSSFRVHLPALQDAVGAAAASDTEIITRGQGQWILIVDDESRIRQVMGQTLSRHGYRVLSASNGAEAVALCAQHQRELQAMIVDLIMPLMNGEATIHAVRQIIPELAIIVCSGTLGSQHEVNLKPITAGFLPKPFSSEQLLHILHHALSR